MVCDFISHDRNKHVQKCTLPLQAQYAVNTDWQICQMRNMPTGKLPTN